MESGQLISHWPGGYPVVQVARELAVINEGNRLNVEVYRGFYGHNQEHNDGVGYESPLDRLPSAIDGVNQCGDTLEE